MSIAELRPPAAPDKIPTADELINRARALAPKLRERVLKAERDRNLPPETVEEYIDAGLIHTLQPKRWGGYEHDHEVAFDIAIELGKSTCTSSAWVLNYFTDHACILALFPEEAQHDVWSQNKAACIATSAAPTGKVSLVPGGYRLDGRWAWCSGLRYSQWIMVGGLIFREGEDHPDMRLFLVPVSEIKQDDTWYCAGLRGTGSVTTVCDNVFVPEHRTVRLACCVTRARPARRSIQIRSIGRPSSPCTPTHCSVPRLVRRAAATLISWNGRASASDLHPTCHRPARASAAQSRGDRSANRCGRTIGAACAGDCPQRLYRHVNRNADAATSRFHLRHAHVARGDGCAHQD